MNRAFLIGNLTKDPEMRQTQTGVNCCTFTIAVNRRPNKDGTHEADFLNIVTWRGTAESCFRYLKKGRKVSVLGSIQTRSYDDRNGQKRYVTEIIADDVEFLSRETDMRESTDVLEDWGTL